MSYTGIDVSKHQGKINWDKVDTDFAIIRCGYSNSDGSIVEDAYFKQNMQGANAAGIPVGVYLYSYTTTADGSAKAARAVLDMVRPYKVQLPLFFDFEDKKYCNASLKKSNTNCIKAALGVWEKAGYYAAWYTYKSFALSFVNRGELAKYDFWLAHYTKKTDYNGEFGIWQYSDKGRVSGVSGNVDMNISYKDYPAIIAKAGLNRLTVKDIVFDDVPADKVQQVKDYAAKMGVKVYEL